MDTTNKKRIIIGSRQRINATEVTTEQAAKSLISYIEQGITHFDTADHYADGEDILGLLKRIYGNSITAGTKRCPEPDTFKEGEVEAALQKSLLRLQSDSIDLLQFHDWAPNLAYGIERLYTLNELRKKGFIKKIGLTNANTDYLKKAIQEGISIVSNQVCYSLLNQRPSSKMMEFCLEHNIEVLAFGTVAGGFLSEKWLRKPEPSFDTLSNASVKKYKRFIDVAGGREWFQRLLGTLEIIAKNHVVSIATVASNFILNKPAVGAVIIGARLGESEHIAENKKILSLEPKEYEHEMIQNILDQATPFPGDFGDEYRLDHSQYGGGHESLTSTGKSGYAGHQDKYIT